MDNSSCRLRPLQERFDPWRNQLIETAAMRKRAEDEGGVRGIYQFHVRDSRLITTHTYTDSRQSFLIFFSIPTLSSHHPLLLAHLLPQMTRRLSSSHSQPLPVLSNQVLEEHQR
jgi:hypothetical protein